MQPVQDLTIDTTVSRTQYQFTLEDANPAELSEWTLKLVDRLRQMPEFEGAASDQQDAGLSAYLTIDRDTAGRFGVTPGNDRQRPVRCVRPAHRLDHLHSVEPTPCDLEATPALQSSLTDLDNIYLPSSTAAGGQVPLSALVKVSQRRRPCRSITSANFLPPMSRSTSRPVLSLGAAVDAVRQAEADIRMPASIFTVMQGAALAFQSALGNELFLILAAIVTVYIVLGVLYESYIHPVTILSTLPSAGIGALLALMVMGDDLGVIAIIGIVLLIGIVKKNAIMMIDFALIAEREEGKPPREAIHQACLLRLRPILMTTIAAILGAVPLMIGSGTGSELRNPLGLTIVGGLIVSQMLTLYTTPVIYLAFDRLARRLGGRGSRIDDAEEQPSAMNFSEAFIRRPIATTLLTVGIALAGAIAFVLLPVSPLPQVDFPTISVQAQPAGRQPRGGGDQRRRRRSNGISASSPTSPK